ncbi:hypothetical protein CMV_001803 [Castanea mollissima]|uniref:Uncharacterized protein n=1 Tax=Castanea mollissima TaxID=60419 RepID=A0A8J4S019_9ROSI|nr:hypothetical protein CMV_001803 [Castanea mollissima]
MQESSVLSVSPLSPPSFNSYSSEKLSDIAARVVEELRLESESDPDSDIFNWPPKPTQPQPPQQQQQDKEKDDNNSDKEKREYEEEEEEEDDDDFEFAFVCRESDTTTISADEIFSNGQIRPTYPIFDQSLLLTLNDSHIEKTNTITTTTTTTTTTRKITISAAKAPSSFRRPPLRKLMIEEQERDRDTSCSSSEADDLEGVPDGTYCVWTPHSSSSSSSSSCKKSHSTGSSKRWRFRDLLYRSNSDGKDTFVFLTPSKKAEKIAVRNNSISKSNSNSNSSNKNKTSVVNNKVAEENKRKSFLPYRKDLVGFFTNVNGLNRSLQPF